VKFETKYTEEQFIKTIDGGLKTTGYIIKKLGCARATAITYLSNMEREGLVKKVEIDEGESFVWRLVIKHKSD
jgi:DNA-binding IclR family transcriptional regulator